MLHILLPNDLKIKCDNNWIENYQCEEHEVLEASVEMRLFLELDDHLKVGVVYVRVHPEEALEDRLDNVTEVGRESRPCLASALQTETHMVIGQTTKIKSQTQVHFSVCNVLHYSTTNKERNYQAVVGIWLHHPPEFLSSPSGSPRTWVQTP